ncbi:hypothetical protein QO012_001774 [Methylobacterium aerolatum]|uniref:Uncharacterized protein n=1 Tax=Methylobacterium aerolatum TaxID=418708 RepID=A0ABU0HY62_9HYPH|nr:hypothetical protein [Methylobacterium aerolatum]GJD36944.1 hypothetical protein FMGBMHLM_3869 [Methylobacterium aerolatum]
MAKIEVCGAEIEVGGGALFLSLLGVGEVWAETVTNADAPRPFGCWWTETGSMLVEWGTVHMVLSPSRAPA